MSFDSMTPQDEIYFNMISVAEDIKHILRLRERHTETFADDPRLKLYSSLIELKGIIEVDNLRRKI